MFLEGKRVGINCNKKRARDMTFYLNKSDLRVQLNHKKSIEKLSNNKHRLNLKSSLNVWFFFDIYPKNENFNAF